MRVGVLLVCWAAAAWGQGLEAGTARREVTPKEAVPMWGYGDRHDQLSQGVADPLWADALVMSLGGKKLAIVGLDLGRAPAEPSLERIKARIRRETGIENVMVAGSHTHHGPVMELSDSDGRGRGRFDAVLRYYEQMEAAVAEAVAEANAGLRGARMAVGSAQLAGYNANRQSKIAPGVSDRELAVMRLDGLDGKPLAVLVNWAAHPTTIAAENLKFSADYVGYLKQAVTRETGAATVFIQGAAGDQRTERGGKDTRAYGEALGAEAVRLARSLAPVAVEKPSLEVREERLKFASRVDFRNPIVSVMYEKAFFPELVRNYQDEYDGGVRPRLTVALLNGEVALVGASGEFFSAHALRLKERARVRQLFFFGYCNGYHQYFPTIEAAAEGGYGADPGVAVAEVGAGEKMMDTALMWLYQMRGRIQR